MDARDLEESADSAAAARDFRAARVALERAVALVPSRFELWIKLAAVCRAVSDLRASLNAVDRALTLNPFDFSTLLMRATMLDAQGQAVEAGLGYGRALAQMPDVLPPQLEPVIAAARAKHAAWQQYQSNLLHVAAQGAAEITPRVARFIDNIVGLNAPDRKGPTHYCFPDLPEIPFHALEDFPQVTKLSEKADDIRNEFEAFIAQNRAELVPYIQYPETMPLEQWAELNHNSDWTALHLINRGRQVDVNTAHCPKTLSLVSHLPQPQILAAGPNAMFSMLAPKTHIPPHHGIANVRLVCHLPLIVPRGCWFRVGDDRREWEVGVPWVFDDTIEHEAANPSDALRVILIVDVWHPKLDANERRAIAAIIGAGGGIHGL